MLDYYGIHCPSPTENDSRVLTSYYSAVCKAIHHFNFGGGLNGGAKPDCHESFITRGDGRFEGGRAGIDLQHVRTDKSVDGKPVGGTSFSGPLPSRSEVRVDLLRGGNVSGHECRIQEVESECGDVGVQSHCGGAGESAAVSSDVKGVRAGPNVERNRINRAAQKIRRNKRKELGKDWRKRDGGEMVDSDGAPGAFWNSTSNSVRQRLIDSKAEMHIAENERRTQEARDKIAYMKSPEATMRKAIGMIEFAEKQAKKENDSKVYGWAKTVATSSAESLARSTPDSVPSFDELSAKLAASSQSSFELELKAKQDEIDAYKKKLEQESNRVQEFERVKEQQVSKVKHDAVVKRMRQLELEKNKETFSATTRLDPNLGPSMKSSDQAYARKSYIKQFGFYPYDKK